MSTKLLEALLKPRSIAVIGASRRPGTIGNTLFHNLLQQEFKGVVYPVNPNADAVASVKTYPSILDVPGQVDLAVIITPADTVLQLIEECGQKNVHAVIVISAGFGESGPEGMAKQDQLLTKARDYGIRLLGPNCMGVINTSPEVTMNATFSPVFPPAGNISMGTQSGALGLAILEFANSLNIGISTFVSIGNRTDVSSNDLLQFWRADPTTDVILLYLESFGNPRRFARIARSISPQKPILAVKSGRTPAGSKAASSHTGALATTEVASEALFEQTGIIRVDTLEELFDTANLLCHQPIPAGRKVAILTNGGGPGIMTADACSARNLLLPDLSENTISGLHSFLPDRASIANPIDMTAEATAEQYSRALELLVLDGNVDIVIVIFIPPIVTNYESVANAIRDVSKQFRTRGKVLIASFMGQRGTDVKLGSGGDCCVPSYAFPEAAATAISKACEYRDWKEKPRGKIPSLGGIDKRKAKLTIKKALKQNSARPLWLDAAAVNDLLEAYGIHLVPSKVAVTPEEAAKSAKEIGFPVAVKLLSKTLTHKTEVKGVVLDIRSEKETEEAFSRISETLAATGQRNQMDGVLVQKMVTEGIEVIIGMTEDPTFGPLIMFGLGGIYTELFRDTTFRIHPLTDIDAYEMIRSVKAYQLLKGWRGSKSADVDALSDLLLRVSAMVEDLPEIAEFDLNPVKALEAEKGYAVVDTRILLK